ncbi:PREDICTED: leucine-rich repeat extensin-like protein 1 [Tarenaya hassleriana]|uniref:leucine-rich repeat extensin-like protein 1 n=1 Tax=Tarenaya hassleriana TaxID=28532 RepID=UPI00053C9B9E|nr:PREDICTED: leucine-rich repeat extensin-like protein 1 [Tarenaya hassleriana]
MGKTSESGRLVMSIVVLMIVNMAHVTVSEVTCPYPCYPPPIGGGFSVPTPVFNPPPAAGYYYPSPTTATGNLPNYPSPPYDGGSFYGPPPPEPILPYFPFYYRKPPHQFGDQSSSSPLLSPTLLILCLSSFAFMAFFW